MRITAVIPDSWQHEASAEAPPRQARQAIASAGRPGQQRAPDQQRQHTSDAATVSCRPEQRCSDAGDNQVLAREAWTASIEFSNLAQQLCHGVLANKRSETGAAGSAVLRSHRSIVGACACEVNRPVTDIRL